MCAAMAIPTMISMRHAPRDCHFRTPIALRNIGKLVFGGIQTDLCKNIILFSIFFRIDILIRDQ